MDRATLIEHLASAEHVSWARWMAYLLSKCERHEDGSATIPAWAVAGWQRQVETPYAQLSGQERQADREEVAHILPAIDAYAMHRREPLCRALVRIAGRAGSTVTPIAADCAAIFCEATNALSADA